MSAMFTVNNGWWDIIRSEAFKKEDRKETNMNVKETFDKYEDEFLEFDRVEHKKCNRPDIHAFLLLNNLFPNNRKMISAAEHDQIWLDINLKEFEKIASNEVVCELRRCGVFYEEAVESLSMFV